MVQAPLSKQNEIIRKGVGEMNVIKKRLQRLLFSIAALIKINISYYFQLYSKDNSKDNVQSSQAAPPSYNKAHGAAASSVVHCSSRPPATPLAMVGNIISNESTIHLPIIACT
jgi:hypothetical protein